MGELLLRRLLAVAFATTVFTMVLPVDGRAEDDVASTVSPAVPGGGLDGFESPYLGHTGPADGVGGFDANTPLAQVLDLEQSMGLRWTWMPVWWSRLEQDGPDDEATDPYGAWASVDERIAQSRARGLNVFLQITVGGNAGGPPAWAGRRVEGSSAPRDIDDLADFAERLARRYAPGGTLSVRRGWTDGYGVRAWEMDNEPSSYLTHWGAVDDDYAEFVVKATQRIKAVDPLAVIVAPAQGPGGDDQSGNKQFTHNVLSAANEESSPTYRANGVPYAIGPSTDAVSLHSYEQFDRVFHPFGADVEDLYALLKAQFAAFEDQPGWEFAPKTEFWHTEGGYDFSLGDPPGLGAVITDLPNTGYRANWMLQWFARSFAVGITKVTIMDANQSTAQQQAMRTMSRVLPDPFPMDNVTASLGHSEDEVSVYRVTEDVGTWTYLAWAANASPFPRTVTLPVRVPVATKVTRDGVETPLTAAGGTVTLTLQSGAPFSEPVFVAEVL